jgi:hypothetical protein
MLMVSRSFWATSCSRLVMPWYSTQMRSGPLPGDTFSARARGVTPRGGDADAVSASASAPASASASASAAAVGAGSSADAASGPVSFEAASCAARQRLCASDHR